VCAHLCRPSADLDASLASLPPSMLGPRRDCNGLQTSTPDGASPPDGSRHGPSDTGTADDVRGATAAQLRAPFGQVTTADGRERAGNAGADAAMEGTPSTLRHREATGMDGWHAQDAAQKGAASKAAAAFEKENAQPNGLASAAAFLRTAPVPGEGHVSV
jgi:hypothetical protein